MLILKKLDFIQQNIDKLELFGTLEGILEVFLKFIYSIIIQGPSMPNQVLF